VQRAEAEPEQKGAELLELWVVVPVKWTAGAQSVSLEKAVSREEWGQEP